VQLRPLFLILDDEVGEPNLQLVPFFQDYGCRESLAVDIGPVRRAEVTRDGTLAIAKKLAVTPAEPAVIDPHTDGNAAAELDGETIDGDFARGGQNILAQKLDFHGRREEANAGGER